MGWVHLLLKLSIDAKKTKFHLKKKKTLQFGNIKKVENTQMHTSQVEYFRFFLFFFIPVSWLLWVNLVTGLIHHSTSLTYQFPLYLRRL